MTELAGEPLPIPSINDYAKEYGLNDMPLGVQLREHAIALSGYRAALARARGVTEEQLHRGETQTITVANINQI